MTTKVSGSCETTTTKTSEDCFYLNCRDILNRIFSEYTTDYGVPNNYKIYLLLLQVLIILLIASVLVVDSFID